SSRAPCYLPLLLMSMPSPPPTSVFFPYTSLFRSGCYFGLRFADLMNLDRDDLLSRELYYTPQKTIRHNNQPKRLIVSDNAFEIIDRKSTRLNSSHVSISYAVFCLKKKTIM